MELVQITVRLPPEVMTSLRVWAGMEHKQMSALIRDICQAAVMQREKALVVHSILPEVSEVLEQSLSAFTNRTAHFMMRTFLEAATARRLLLETGFHHLSDDELAQLNTQAWNSSVKSLKTSTEDLQTLQRNLREGLL